MDFFQIITTPNEELINILSIPLTFLDATISMLFFTTVLNIETTKKQKIIYILTFSCLAICINLIFPNLYSTFINMILWPVLVKIIFKTSVLKSFLSEVIVYAITATLDVILAKLIQIFCAVSINVILVTPLYRIGIVCTIYLIIFILRQLFIHFKLNIEIFENISRKTKTLLIANLLLMIIVIAMQFYLLNFYVDTMPILISIISVFSLVAYFIISLYSIISSSKLERTTKNLEGANLTIHSLSILHDTVRTFKHDFDNIVNSIGGYVRNNDMEGLNTYYNQLLQDCNKTNNLYTLSPEVINHPAIYNILATKYYIADELNIQINLDIFLDLYEIEKHMKIYEFTRILGILLDNSIEAASECEEKLINVIFRKDEKIHRITIIIENTYQNKDIDINRIFEKGFSSKSSKTNSGLGLWKIRQILKKNNNLNLHTSKTEKLFKQQFEIYY